MLIVDKSLDLPKEAEITVVVRHTSGFAPINSLNASLFFSKKPPYDSSLTNTMIPTSSTNGLTDEVTFTKATKPVTPESGWDSASVRGSWLIVDSGFTTTVEIFADGVS